MFQTTTKRRQRSDSKTLRTRVRQQRSREYRLRLESLEPRMMLSTTAGTWTALANTNPAAQGMLELLSNGSVMVAGNAAQAWEELTPSASGSYVNATWSPLASMSETRLYDATEVLQDGRVMVLGGEYTSPPYTLTTTDTGEIYNPVTNTWTAMAPFPEPHFGAGPTVMLPNGDVLAGRDGSNGLTFIYDPTANTWSPGPTKADNDSSNSEPWTQLANGDIMSVDIYADRVAGQTEILDPTTMTWSDSGMIPAGLLTLGQALGPATLLPDGQVFQLGGANSNTALYDPSSGQWTAGPTLPNGLETIQSSAAMMTNGDVLFGAGGATDGPVHIFEYNPTDNSLTDVSPAFSLSASSAPFVNRMLALPSGQVLAEPPGGATGEMYVYTPSGSPQAAWQPTITSVVADANGDGNYTLTGTQLNGLSAGASYGASINEMASNYPIVELSNGSGQVYFARTFNWSSTGVATGSTPVSTDFSLPAYLPYGTYSLSVVANGIASAPVSFTGGYTNEADLAVTNTGPAAANEGDSLSYNLSVTNNGPTTATNVVLTDTLDANLKYVSATKSQGSLTHSGSTVTFSFGTVAVGQTVTGTVTAQALEDGNLTNVVAATSSLSDANLNNNTASVTTAVSEPAIFVFGSPYQFSGKNLNKVLVATVEHANGVEPASAFIATINWGDGSTSTGTITQQTGIFSNIYNVVGSHSYAKNGTYRITTTVVEATGSGNSTMFASASAATTPAASTSTSVNTSTKASARDVVFANAAGFGGWTSPSWGKVDGAGAQPVTDLDSLDGLFESLGAGVLAG